jgi:hypothetical protein
MQVRTGGSTALPNFSHGLPLPNSLAFLHEIDPIVGIDRDISLSVLDDDKLTVSTDFITEDHPPSCCSHNRNPMRS